MDSVGGGGGSGGGGGGGPTEWDDNGVSISAYPHLKQADTKCKPNVKQQVNSDAQNFSKLHED